MCLLESYTWIPIVLGKGQGSCDPVPAAALQFKVCITEDCEKQDKLGHRIHIDYNSNWKQHSYHRVSNDYFFFFTYVPVLMIPPAPSLLSPAGNHLPWTMRIRNFSCIDQIVIIVQLSQNWNELCQLCPPHKAWKRSVDYRMSSPGRSQKLDPLLKQAGDVTRALGEHI